MRYCEVWKEKNFELYKKSREYLYGLPGNSLIEPVTNKPVSIIEEDKLAEADMENMKYIFVPYNTVGKSHGLMKAFVVDKLVVNDITTEKAIIGIYKGKLSQNNKYEMILNPDILNK